MDYTSGFALQTEAGKQVGFMLGDRGFMAESGDCVFMLLPTDPNLVDSPLGIAIAESKIAGEHQWRRQGLRIQVQFNGAAVLEITEQAAIINGSGQVLGKAVPLPKKG